MESRPYLFLENVPGLLTANDRHAFSRVVHQLADIGYHITWGTLSAAAVGAPHRRLRWWGLAWHPENIDQKWSILGSSSEGRPPASAGGTDSYDDATDANGARREGRPVAVTGTSANNRLGSNRDAPADTNGATIWQQQKPQSKRAISTVARFHQSTATDRFGRYAPAIGRWERILGRPALDPTIERRLNPPFVEWMMGYPQGWVTDTLTNRRHALHALGNAVVPQCAAAAWTQLINREPMT